MKVPYSGKTIDYKISGQGPALVFLHGFMETARIWRAFAYKFSSRFKVIRINLPGHGKSGIYGDKHTMDFMAGAVKAVLQQEKIAKCTLIGHSMGGYVALAFAELYPGYMEGLVLFSSVSFADSPERRNDRNRAIKTAEAHKIKYVTSVVPNLFYQRSGNKAGKRIYKLVKLAGKQPLEGITAAIKGMSDRPDRTSVLTNAGYPVLLLNGTDDPLIPAEKVEEMKGMAPGATAVFIPECGHVGFIEKRKESIAELKKFLLQKVM